MPLHSHEQNPPAPRRKPVLGETEGLIVVVAAAVVAGALGGLVGAGFRLALHWAAAHRETALLWLKHRPAWGWVVTIVSGALLAGLARWMVGRFAPAAEGSGIPAVEGIVRREDAPDPLVVLPVKFIAGGMAIGGGLALGREGPTVRMAAVIGGALGKLLHLRPSDVRVLVAAGAGAGLAVAFSAPLAGAIFVLEEIEQRFDFRVAAASFGATAASMVVLQTLLGFRAELAVPGLTAPPLLSLPLFAAFGLVAGTAGVFYNRLTVSGLNAADRIGHLSTTTKAALIGGAVGVVAWFAPSLAGNGDALLHRIVNGGLAIGAIAVIFVVRFVLGPVSYSARTPGGLFWPLLVVGAALGNGFGVLSATAFPVLGLDPRAFAVVGMGTFFAAIVGAPITGAALIVEMTGGHSLLIAMLVSFAGAIPMPMLWRSPPVYEALYERRARRLKAIATGAER